MPKHNRHTVLIHACGEQQSLPLALPHPGITAQHSAPGVDTVASSVVQASQ